MTYKQVCKVKDLKGVRVQRGMREFGRETSGAALVETTLLMPFLLFLAAGVFEFGSVFYQRLLIETGVRDAARYAARCPRVAGFPCDDDQAKNVAVFADPAPPVGASPRVDGWSTTAITITPIYTTNDWISVSGNWEYRGGPQIETIQVDTTFTYTGTGLLQYIGFNNVTFSASHQERYIGW